MRIFVAGVDGYLGWSLAMYLAVRGHEVAGTDCYHRRNWVAEMGSQSATPISRMTERLQAFRENFGTNLQFIRGNMTDYNFVWNFFRSFEPEAIIHFAEMPSASYSMIDVHHCNFTHTNNLIGTLNILHAMRDICPDAHLVKLGTMGEYGAPNIDIPEGFFEIEYRGRKDILPFPKKAGSWYHQCYDDKTEILTENGWKLFKKLTSIDKVATLNVKNNELEYQFPTKRIVYSYTGKMHRVKTKSIDLAVTPKHEMLIGNKTRVCGINWKLKKIEEVVKMKNAYYKRNVENWLGKDKEAVVIPFTPVKTGKKSFKIVGERKIRMDDWLLFLGWFISEGSIYEAKNEITIYQEKEKNFEEIKRAINGLNVNCTERKNGDKIIGFSFRNSQIFSYLKNIGMAVSSKDRYIPNDIKQLSKNRLSILLDSLIKGDGTTVESNKFVYYTSSKKLADDVQEIAFKLGYNITVGEPSDSNYKLSITDSTFHQAITKTKRNKPIYSEKDYSGKVYCCEVPNSIIFVRRNGKSVWCGNTKVHDTNNIMMACRFWGLRSTDIMQGVVFGTRIDEMGDDERLLTRFDFDQCFGTAINRFCAQAIVSTPLTPFGKGHQRRGFLPLRDSMQCLTIAIENPPKEGEYRVFNQFEEVYDLTELALKVQKVASGLGLEVKVRNLENPRIESEEHYYNPDHKHLLDLGYQPTHDIEAETTIILNDLMKYKPRIEARAHVLIPDIRWDGSRKKVGYV